MLLIEIKMLARLQITTISENTPPELSLAVFKASPSAAEGIPAKAMTDAGITVEVVSAVWKAFSMSAILEIFICQMKTIFFPISSFSDPF